ncbi:MAG: hypothetical protein JSV23_03885 [Promethearchaeota archaeon]|nr:MAG: hypothetical protein JSV23_03885 [Candidatus Lokiarchaeota archaeon]
MLIVKFMILNDLNAKVKGKFYKEFIIEDDGEDLVYVFPDTKEFLSIIRRKELKKKLVSRK